MTCSPARLAANRSNAQKSTGPRTDEGKFKSRANAIKHGLCASIAVPEDTALIEARIAEWFCALKPQNEFHAWMVEQVAVASIKIDRAQRMERRLRDRKSLGAELAWEDDRRFEVEVIGGKIASRPAEVVEHLRKTPTGCDWLISRWVMLAHAADISVGVWSADQTALAFHLLGTPMEFRDGREPGDLLDIDGQVTDTGQDRAAFARREIARLIERKEALAPLDEVDQALTVADLFDESHPELKNLRRYEGVLFSRLRWCLGEIRHIPIHFKTDPHLKYFYEKAPAAEAVVVAEVQVEPVLAVAAPIEVKKGRIDVSKIPSPHPPFDLDVSELPKDGSKPDFLKILITRQEKRLAKAEARREARRSKLERMRA